MTQRRLGWKLLHGDVFRFPPHSNLFAAMVSRQPALPVAVPYDARQKEPASKTGRRRIIYTRR